MLATAIASQADDFTLKEQLGHTWIKERVTFPLTPAQRANAVQRQALAGPNDKVIPYQLVTSGDVNNTQISFQADLSPMESRTYRFADQPAAAQTDLKVSDSTSELRVENQWIGLAIRKTLQRGQGPIAGVRLRSGMWTGGSALIKTPAVKSYTVQLMAGGPVFIEILCLVNFADGGRWSLRFQVERNEPLVLVEESFDVPGGGNFEVRLGNETCQPTHLFYRSGVGEDMGRANSAAIGAGKLFVLEPWLHWWESERQGNWFALCSPDSYPERLMIGLLRPSAWKDPQWSPKARQGELKVPA
ncbi:MAG: hypothetical protein EXR84_13935 [Gammaproteobacteria bacterium]|nr:hypothetical protein [Gammaproteobacteria bacterium]